MKANQLKASEELAKVVLGNINPLVTQEGRFVYEYLNGERTDKIKGYATELVLTNQNFEKVRCITPTKPAIFMRGNISEAMQVEVINPVAEITYQNEIKLNADDIILYDDEVVL